MTSTPGYRSGQVHLLGLAGFSRNIGFGVNKVFAAALLQALQASQPLIGFILGLEGLLGILMNPLTGWLSDRTRIPGLRRKVYVLICLPGAAVAWLLFAASHSLVLAGLALTLFYLFQQGSISPYQAWMPELVPVGLWGIASGYLNLWWQLGNLVAFLVIPLVWSVSHGAAYLLVALLMTAGGLVTGFFVPERPTLPSPEVAGFQAVGWKYTKLFRGNLLLYFLSQAFAWLSFEAIASFFTLFILHQAHGTVLDSALAMSLFTFTGLIAALLSGGLYRRFSPKGLLALSLGLFGALALPGIAVHQMWAVFFLVGVEGVFWSANLTVAFALATDLLRQAAWNRQEEATMRGGLYGMGNVVQSIGLIVAAPTAGLVIRASGGNYGLMFLVASSASFFGLICVLLMRPQRKIGGTMKADLQMETES